MDIPLDKKRNITIIAHGGAGKTSLSEAILFNAKATDKLGESTTAPPPSISNLKNRNGK